MKLSYFILLLVIVAIITILIVLLISENLSLKNEVYNKFFDNNVIAINNDQTFLEKKIVGKSIDPNYKIKVYYPYTSYNLLNNIIESKLTKEIDSLMQIAKENIVQPNQYYTLNINYEYYNYQKYTSYVFYISIYTGVAHPRNGIWTITYDKSNNKIVTLEDIKKKYPLVLEKLSQESRNILNKDKRFSQNEDLKDMLIDGTTPNENNFNSFAFSKDGLILFFEQYQIAPYSYGDFEITIPYDKIF